MIYLSTYSDPAILKKKRANKKSKNNGPITVKMATQIKKNISNANLQPGTSFALVVSPKITFVVYLLLLDAFFAFADCVKVIAPHCSVSYHLVYLCWVVSLALF